MLKIGMLCISLLAGIALVGLITAEQTTDISAAESLSYYVAPDGNDTHSGTLQSPWKTLQHAADQAEPGSTVYLRGGTYKQKLKISRSGTASAGSITFTRYGNEQPIVDGQGLSVNGIEGLIELDHASYITIKGLEIRNYTTASRNQVPVGIYVHGAGGHIQLLDNHIHHIRNTAVPAGKELQGRDAHGIAVYGTEAPASVHHLTISGNELNDLVLGSSEALAVNGNVDTFSILNNRVHDNDNIGIDVIGFEGTASQSAYDQARNGIIQGNTVYNISSNRNPSYGRQLPNHSNAAGGIYVDGGKNTVIERNTSYNNDIGIELASEHAGKATSGITVRSNMIYSNRYTGIAIGGYDEERGTTVNCVIINNTLYRNDTLSNESGNGSGQLLVQYGTSNNRIQNNIISASATNVLIYNEYASSGNQIDYNLYDAPGGSQEASWTWNDHYYEGWSAYQKGSRQDAHSQAANPRFVHATQQDYHLQSGSPAIDKGRTDLKRIGKFDMDGQPRLSGKSVDIGADEFQQ